MFYADVIIVVLNASAMCVCQVVLVGRGYCQHLPWYDGIDFYFVLRKESLVMSIYFCCRSECTIVSIYVPTLLISALCSVLCNCEILNTIMPCFALHQ